MKHQQNQRKAHLEAVIGRSVSRETLELLENYGELLAKWTKRINLVAPSTITDLWTRHILDSAQLLALIGEMPRTWIDVGSGGGLPAVVASILLPSGWSTQMTLIESDIRKAAFLQTARRELGLRFDVIADRTDRVSLDPPEILTARAFAPLHRCLESTAHLLGANTRCLFPKGRNHQQEIAAARQEWDFTLSITPSKTDPEAAILDLGGIERAPR